MKAQVISAQQYRKSQTLLPVETSQLIVIPNAKISTSALKVNNSVNKVIVAQNAIACYNVPKDCRGNRHPELYLLTVGKSKFQ